MNITDINPYVRLARHSILPEHYSINDRVIFDYELICIDSGECDITVGGTRRRYRAGEAVLLVPGITHRFDVGDVPFSQPHIHFDIAYDIFSKSRFVNFKDITKLSKEERLMISDNVFSKKASSGSPVTSDLPLLFTLVLQVIDKFEKNGGLNDIFIKSRMMRIIELISDEMTVNEEKATESTVYRLKRYIDANLTQNLSLDGLSSQFGMNKYTLLRCFESTYGKGIGRYVADGKAELAKVLLLQGISVGKVAQDLGFDSIYTFSRFFKGHEGIAPSQYRHAKTRIEPAEDQIGVLP